MTMDRRDFLKKATLGAAVIAGSGFLVGCNSTEATAPASAPAEWDMETDVVVVGGGNGGLSAGAAAVEEGKSVILCEISAFLGGGSAYSGGTIHAWGLETWEEYNKHAEGIEDQVLAKTFVETFRQEYIPWLQAIGIPLTRHPAGGKGYSKDWQLGSGEQGYLRHKAYFDALKNYIEGKGSTVMTETRVLRLVIDEGGMVSGVQAIKKGETSSIFIKAGSVVLATGGFQSNKGLMAKYMGLYGDTARTYGTPYNTGSGMLMAQGVGAMTNGSFSTFSGSLVSVVPGPCVEDNPEEYENKRAGDPATLAGINGGRPTAPQWVNALFPEDTLSILVNLEGKRFVDESSPIDAKYARIPQAVLKQKRGVALAITDKAIYDKVASSEAVLKLIEAQGGQVIVGDTLEEFAMKLQDTFGVYKGALMKTINEYNKAIDNGTTDNLDIARVSCHNKLAQGPYYAVAITAGVYHTFGGLEINENAQVLDIQRTPIPNLYACPPCAGGVFKEVYAGGIASAGVFGYLAGKHLAK